MPPRELPTSTAGAAALQHGVDLGGEEAARLLARRTAGLRLVVGIARQRWGRVIGCRRSRGQPLLSKRHSVVIHSAALSPLPCTKTMGGAVGAAGAWARLPGQPASAAAASSRAVRRVRKCVMSCEEVEAQKFGQAGRSEPAGGAHRVQHRARRGLCRECADQREVGAADRLRRWRARTACRRRPWCAPG